MKLNEKYNNGQVVSEQKGDTLTYFLKSGKVKAKGRYIDGKMDGKWIFNRATGELWQIGHFNMGKREGRWVRYSKTGEIELDVEFRDDKKIEK